MRTFRLFTVDGMRDILATSYHQEGDTTCFYVRSRFVFKIDAQSVFRIEAFGVGTQPVRSRIKQRESRIAGRVS